MFRLLSIFLILALCACASPELKRQVREDSQKLAALESQISVLEKERQRVSDSLQALNGRGQSLSADAETLRQRLSDIDTRIDQYGGELNAIRSGVAENREAINTVSDQQSRQSAAIREALAKNRQLKDETVSRIQELEAEYDKKRESSDDGQLER